MAFLPLTSFQVTTFATPGIFSASEVSMPLILACETFACTSASRKVSGGMCKATSAPKSHVPVTFATAEGGGTWIPESAIVGRLE